MLKFLRSALIAIVVVLALGGAAAYALLQDANRFKPRLEALIETQTGVPLRINGDLAWRLWPPVSLSAEDLQADYQDQSWQVGQVTLDLDALDLLGDPGQWEIQALTLRDVAMSQQGGLLQVNQARMAELAPNRPAPFDTQFSYTAPGGIPLPVDMQGNVQVNPETLALALNDTRIVTPQAEGTCDFTAQPVANPLPAPPATPADLIPVDVFRSYSWQGECLLDWVQVEDRRFENVTVQLDNAAGDSTARMRIPAFFGGQAEADIAIDAAESPVRWAVTPTFTDIDSSEFLAWLDQRLNWAAPLAYGGTLTFEGNTAEHLIASMSGETRFDGGQGSLDITTIKDQLLTLANRFNEGERIARWPDVWQYQRFVGTWRIDRQRHLLDAALDNLTVTGTGDYAPATGEIDMLLELVFGNDPALPVFELDPLLYDLPIPVRCRGAVADPVCRVDPDAAARIVTQALSGAGDSELRAKLEQRIDQEVPEQYRDAARSLLDMLGGSRNEPPGDG